MDDATPCRVVEGHYKCSVPFALLVSALETEYRAQIDGRAVTVRLPRLVDGTSAHRHHLGEPPFLYGGQDDLLSQRPELAPFWGQVVRWESMQFECPKGVSISRIGIAFDATGDDVEVRECGRRMAEALPAWWSAVSAWIEVRYGQDLSRLGLNAPGIRFSDTTLRAMLFSISGRPVREGHVLPVGSSGFTVVYSDFAEIDAAQLQWCIDTAEACGAPSAEWLLVRDAQSLCAGQDYRRAVLDAGLAAELAVTQLIRTHLANRGATEQQITLLLEKTRMLGPRCRFWQESCAGSLPTGYKVRLLDRRNRATHSGAGFSEADVRDVIAVATDIVAQAIPLPA